MYDFQHLYHITKINYIDSIIINGLIPQYQHGFVKKSNTKHYRGKLFFTDDVDYIIEKQLGRVLFNEKFLILKINVLGLNIQQYTTFLTSVHKHPHEFVYEGVIERERIDSIYF